MRTFTLLIFLLSFVIWPATNSQAQDIMVNGDLELWDDVNNPTAWTKIEAIDQETLNVHGGTYSAKHNAGGGTQDLRQSIGGVQAGLNYTITYWFLDNDPGARTRIWSYWTQAGGTIPDHEDILRPGTYSEDNADWQEFSVTLTAPPGADGFQFEVRVYEDAPGGVVYYDDFSLVAAGVLPEPTNYPTDFMAVASGPGVNLTWTDAMGDQEPSAYLILGSDADDIMAPIDGNFETTDSDLSDGSGALNISQGQEMANFSNLLPETTYYFKIFPYTNGGDEVDYKTDGTAPSDEATTPNVVIIEYNFFDDGFGDWETIDLNGAQMWGTADFGDDPPCAYINGYEGGCVPNEDWIISPAMDFNMYQDETLTFLNATNYTGPPIETLISTDYDGGGDPSTATWESLTPTLSTGGFDWVSSGDVDLSGYNGEAVYVAFRYLAYEGTDNCAPWEIDNVLITGQESVGIDDEISAIDADIYPNPATNQIFVASENTLDVKVYNILGSLVMEQNEVAASSALDISQLEPGMYFVVLAEIETGNAITKRLVKR